MANVFDLAKMCLKPKKRHKPPVVFPYKKKFLWVGGRRVIRGGSPPAVRALLPEARFAAPPGAETSKTATAAAPSAHIYVNLTHRHPFQAVVGLSPGTRSNLGLVQTPPAHAASDLKNLRRCRPPPALFWRPPLLAF